MSSEKFRHSIEGFAPNAQGDLIFLGHTDKGEPCGDMTCAFMDVSDMCSQTDCNMHCAPQLFYTKASNQTVAATWTPWPRHCRSIPQRKWPENIIQPSVLLQLILTALYTQQHSGLGVPLIFGLSGSTALPCATMLLWQAGCQCRLQCLWPSPFKWRFE